MPMPPLLPPFLKGLRRQRCQRCGLYYPRKAEACPHCSGLNERELGQLQDRLENQRQAHSQYGALMLTAAALLLGALIVIAIAL